MQYEQQKRTGSAERGMGAPQNVMLRIADSRFCGGRRAFELRFEAFSLTPRISGVLSAEQGAEPLQRFAKILQPLKRFVQPVLRRTLLQQGVNDRHFSSQNT